MPLARAGERVDLLAALIREGHPTRRGHTDLLGQPELLLAQLGQLARDLLAPRHETLGLELRLLHGLTEIGELVVALLDAAALCGLARPQLAEERLVPRPLDGEPLDLLGHRALALAERHELAGEHRQRERLLLLVERLVLL